MQVNFIYNQLHTIIKGKDDKGKEFQLIVKSSDIIASARTVHASGNSNFPKIYLLSKDGQM
jgi:hypothetical protein